MLLFHKLNQTDLYCKMHKPLQKLKQKFQLTIQQKQLIQFMLPKRYSLRKAIDQQQQYGKNMMQQAYKSSSESVTHKFTTQKKFKNKKLQINGEKSKYQTQPSKSHKSPEIFQTQKSKHSYFRSNMDIEKESGSRQLRARKNAKVSKNYKSIQAQNIKVEDELASDLQHQRKGNTQYKQLQQAYSSIEDGISNKSFNKQFCLKLINKLKSHKSSWPFRLPVDPDAQGVPDYLNVIKQPMDLKTIQRKINSNKYQHSAEFYCDLNKIFLNSYKYNPKQTNYFSITAQFQDYYHELLSKAEQDPQVLEKKFKKPQPEPQFNGANVSLKNKKSSQLLRNHKKKYSLQQRKQIVQKVNRLSKKGLSIILEIILENQDISGGESPNYVIDFEKMSNACLQKLEPHLNEPDYYTDDLLMGTVDCDH